MEIIELYLPLIWGALIATAVFIYVILDGFDLGVGMLYRFRSDSERSVMMNSIAPFWDGNETWLVLGGGGLFAAFPLAYAVFMPAVYMPVMLMLIALVFRGVAFEFRFKAEASRILWDNAFFYGSLFAGFMQGVILGAFVQGTVVEQRAFAGGTFDWLSPFSIMTGVALLCGYGLLGACWLLIKTEGDLQAWAYKRAREFGLLVLVFMGIVSLWMPLLHSGLPVFSTGFESYMQTDLFQRWFGWPNLMYLAWVPVAVILIAALFFRSLKKREEIMPYIYSVLLFVLGFIGLAVSVWPNVIPPSVTLYDAAAHPSSLFLMLVGVVFMLPIVLGYTGFIYWVFRGKLKEGEGYHA